MEMYHGSNDSKLAVITAGGLFGGMFFSTCYESAASHGDNIYTIELDDSEIAGSGDLEDGINELRSMFKWLSDEQYDEHQDTITDIIVYESSAYDYDDELMLELFAEEDIASADWYAQKLRGQLAKKLGFKAVTMRDEHGTSYLVLDGLMLTLAD